MLKKTLLFLVPFFCMLLHPACFAMKIGILPASDSLALHVAHDEGIFSEHGLDVELVPFQSALEQAAALRAGALDGWFSDMIAVLVMNESGVPQQFIATMAFSGPEQRFFGIVTSPLSGLERPEDLRGKKIAISKATIIEYMLDSMLAGLGLPADFAERVDIKQISVRLQLLSAGKVDAAVLPEPMLSLMEARGSRVIVDNTATEEPLAVMALRTEAATPEAVAAFQAALAEAMRRINADPEAYRKVMSAKKLLPREAEKTYHMLSFPPDRCPAPPPTEEEVARVARWMFDNKLVRRMPEAGNLVYGAGR